MTDQKGPKLTDAKGMGGIIAQDGFDYQVWSVFAMLPNWLRNPCFEGFAVEMLEDFEARFFSPHSPHKHFIDRFQAKSGVLSKCDLIKIFESFATFNQVHPCVARMQTLVTPALPSTLTWLSRDTGRVSRARPFYCPFPNIIAASENKLRTDLIEEFGGLGVFFADYIEIDLKSFPDRSHAEAAFSKAMYDAFPEHEFGHKKINLAFTALLNLVGYNRGEILTRDHLLQVLSDEFGTTLVSDKNLCIHIRSDSSEPKMDAIEIDAIAYAGGNIPYPRSDLWRSGLLLPLESTANWAREHEYSSLVLTGKYRISTAFAIGWSFRSVIGFEIKISTRYGIWATDELLLPDAKTLPWKIIIPKRLVKDRLLVAVGVLRDPTIDIQNAIGISGDDDLFIATFPQALLSGIDVQLSVQILKKAIASTVSQLRPVGIDIYFVGPAALAVALGHRWNAFPSTQVYEFFSSANHYVPTVILG